MKGSSFKKNERVFILTKEGNIEMMSGKLSLLSWVN